MNYTVGTDACVRAFMPACARCMAWRALTCVDEGTILTLTDECDYNVIFTFPAIKATVLIDLVRQFTLSHRVFYACIYVYVVTPSWIRVLVFTYSREQQRQGVPCPPAIPDWHHRRWTRG